jgi:hypothetical protein
MVLNEQQPRPEEESVPMEWARLFADQLGLTERER